MTIGFELQPFTTAALFPKLELIGKLDRSSINIDSPRRGFANEQLGIIARQLVRGASR